MTLSTQQENLLQERMRILSEAYAVPPEREREKLALLELVETGLRRLAHLQK